MDLKVLRTAEVALSTKIKEIREGVRMHFI
jgi:hypothetical protein